MASCVEGMVIFSQFEIFIQIYSKVDFANEKRSNLGFFWSDAGNSGRWHCSMMGLFTSYLTTSKVSRVTVEAVIIQLGQILDFSDLHSDTLGRPPDDFGSLKSCLKPLSLMFGMAWSWFWVLCENFFLTIFICYVYVWANLRFWVKTLRWKFSG